MSSRLTLFSLSLLLAVQACGAALRLSDPAFMGIVGATNAPAAPAPAIVFTWSGDTNGFTWFEYSPGYWRADFDVLGYETRTVTVQVQGTNGATFSAGGGSVNFTITLGDMYDVIASVSNRDGTASLIESVIGASAEEPLAWESSLAWTPADDSDTLTFSFDFSPITGSSMWFSFTLEIDPE